MSDLAPSLIRSARFRAEREEDWRKLEAIVTKAEKRGVRSLSFDEARDLATLYRQAMTSLSLAREISLDRGLLAYLEALCARAYLTVYAPQENLSGLVWRLLARGIPQATRRMFPLIVLAYAVLALGAVVGFLLFQEDPLWYNTFVPAELAGDRTINSPAAQLRSGLYDGDDTESGQLAAFASFLFSHNTRIAIFVFSLGVLICIPSAVLTFSNGVTLGILFALFHDRGLGPDLAAWLSVHGVTELSAIAIACAGGFQLGLAVLYPGDMTRRDALRQRSRDAVKLAILAAIMLVVAALLEAFPRQLVTDRDTRFLIGAATAVFWISWLGLAGRRRT